MVSWIRLAHSVAKNLCRTTQSELQVSSGITIWVPTEWSSPRGTPWWHKWWRPGGNSHSHSSVSARLAAQFCLFLSDIKKRGNWSFFLRLHINPPVWSWWVSVHHWPGSQPSMCLRVFHPLISSEVHWGSQGMMFGLLPLPWKYAPAAPHSGKMDDTRIPVNPKTCRLKRNHPSWPQMCEKPILTVYVLEMFEVACDTALYSNKAADWDMG